MAKCFCDVIIRRTNPPAPETLNHLHGSSAIGLFSHLGCPSFLKAPRNGTENESREARVVSPGPAPPSPCPPDEAMGSGSD